MTIESTGRLSASLALKAFFRRMICMKLVDFCPFQSGRNWIYRLMGIKIGNDVFIGFNVEFDTNHSELIEIEDNVTISHRCIISTHMATSASTPLRAVYPRKTAPVKIERGAWICAGAILLPGVTVGANALVAAGAVVTRSVGRATLVAGVPARTVKSLDVPA